MATTTYCLKADVEDIISAAGVSMAVDDNRDGINTAAEEARVTRAIAMAASNMNARLVRRYKLSDLSSNDWVKFCNATLASEMVMRRRGNGPPPSVVDAADQYREDLQAIMEDRLDVPEQSESFDFSMSVTNFSVQRAKREQKVRVDKRTSTGDDPDSTLKRFPVTHRLWD